jgi:AcrR family transcriptional regulator
VARSARAECPARRRPRRRQAERTAETRAKVIAAVIDCVGDLGYTGATAVEITRRAGVTWGAVQHHFGGKDGLYLAVVEHSFARFASRLSGIAIEDQSLEKRASIFVDGAWQHFSSATYRATFEILLNHLGREDRPPRGTWQQQLFRSWDRIWMEFLGDAPISRRRHHVLQHYTISVLSGLASSLVLAGPGARLHPTELDLLKDSLARELTGDVR